MDQIQNSLMPADLTTEPQGDSTLENPTSPRSKDSPCNKCGRVLSRPDALIRHHRVVHGTGEYFWCQEPACVQAKKGFRRSRDYRRHMRLAHNTTVSADDVNFRGAGSDYPDDASDHTLQASPQVAPLASLEAAPQIVSQATAQVAPQALPQAYHRVQRRLFRRLHRSLLPRMSYYAPNRIVSWERLADPNEVDHNNYQQLYGRESHPEPQVELQQALQEDPYPEHFLDPKPEQQHVFYQGPQQTFQNPPENQFGYWVANPTQYNANNGLQGFNYQTVDWLQYAIAWADASQLRQEMEAERQAGESHSHPHDPHRFDHLIHPNLADFNERDHMNQLLDVKTHEYQQLKLKYYAVRAELDRTQAVVSWYRDRHAQSDVSGRESHTHQPTSEHPSVDLAQSHEE